MQRTWNVWSLLAVLALFIGCQKEKSELIPQRVEIQQPLMGTLFQVTTYATDVPRARKLIAETFEKGAQIEKVASDYDPESELSRLCAAPFGKPVSLSDDLFTLLKLAHDTAVQTDGAYDPTLGPLTHLWRRTRRSGQLPSDEVLENARQSCGYQFLKLDPLSKTATLQKEGMQLDLGGIAKGYAADQMFHHLHAAGLTQTLVAAGGDLRFGEAPPEKDGWTIGLRTFHLTPSSTKNLVHCAVSTSGDLHQSVTIAGKRYAHLVDPRTGLGLTESKAATVIAPLASTTDPLATAVCLHSNPKTLLEKFPNYSFRILSEDQTKAPLKSGIFLK